MQFDTVLQQIGEKGPYQNFVFYLLCVPASTASVFLVFSQLFVSATPDHWCKIPYFNNSIDGLKISPDEQRRIAIPFIDGKYDKCHMFSDFNQSYEETKRNHDLFEEFSQANLSRSIIPCPQGWNYDKTSYDNTLVTQFDMVCEKSWMTSLSTTLFYTGSLIGNVLFGWVADRWGRRFAFFCILFPDVILSVATAFSPNYEVYTVLRFFCGFCFPALYQVSFILALELMGPHYRTMVGMMIVICFALSMSLLATLGYLLRDWFYLSLATSLPFVFLISYYWIIPESPRWLLSVNRIEDAEKIVQKIALANHKSIPSNFLKNLEEESLSLMNTSNTRPEQVGIASPVDILKYPRIRLRFFILSFDWIANAVIYNGLSYNVSNLGIGDHEAFFVAGLVEIPSLMITWYLMEHWGRRPVLCTFMFFGGLACMSSIFVSEDNTWLTFSLAMIGKFGNAGSFGVFYVFAGELLPTVIRSQAMAIASFIAGIGLLGFPYIVKLGEYNKVYPLVVMGILSACGGIVSIFLPETLNTLLPQTLEDGEELMTENPFSSDEKNNKSKTKVLFGRKKESCGNIQMEELSTLPMMNISNSS